MVRVVNQEMKRGRKDRYEGPLFTCHSLDTSLEGSSLMEGSKKLSEDMVCGNAHNTDIRGLRDPLHPLLSER